MNIIRCTYLLSVLVLLIGLVAAVIWDGTAVVQAGSDDGAWSPPLNVFETVGRASEAEVVADESGTVHVFWAFGDPDAEEEGWGQSIYYARNADGKWSEPVDIVVSPGGRIARTPSIAVDPHGYLHMVWSGGNAIYYSRAYAPAAGSARGWTYPEPLVADVGVLEPAIAAGADGTLYAVWTQFDSGLMFAKSVDGGVEWLEPETIFVADSDTEAARWGRIAVDGLGRLHVVLTHTVVDPQAEVRNDPNHLYYLSSADGGAAWPAPFLVVDEPDFGEINVATDGDDTVHLAWNGRAGRQGRYHRVSTDGGQSWSTIDEIIAPAPENSLGTGGLTGFPVMAVDARGVLHLVSTTGDGDYYFRWENGRWSSPQLISPGIKGNGVTGADSSLEQPSLALGLGNQLHVVFHDGFERIWHTAHQIDAPSEPSVPYAALTPNSTPTDETQQVASLTPFTPTPVVLAPVASFQVHVPVQAPKVLPLAVSFVPAALLIGLVLAVRLAQTRRR